MKKVLRVFLTRYTLRQKHYTETQESHDFPVDVTPEAAYAELLTKHGSVLNGKMEVEIFQGLKVLVAPDQYIKIDSHSIVDSERPKVEIGQGEKMHEQALFGPMELRACLQDSPNLASKRRRKHRSVSE